MVLPVEGTGSYSVLIICGHYFNSLRGANDDSQVSILELPVFNILLWHTYGSSMHLIASR